MNEEWIYISHGLIMPNTVVAISNTGLLKRANGEITPSELRHSHVRIDGKHVRVHRIIAEHFIIGPRRPEQIFVDHITHDPVDMNVNDVRNLRWCTIKENNNFEEAHQNHLKSQRNRSPEWCKRISEGKKGSTPWNKGIKVGKTWNKGVKVGHTWNKGLHGEEYLSHFKDGKIKNQYTLGG